MIAACEAGLWVLIGSGLLLRRVLRLRRTSTVVLASIPLLDVVLVVAVALDLHRGTPAGLIHGLGAVSWYRVVSAAALASGWSPDAVGEGRGR